jgi:hypothetical protein
MELNIPNKLGENPGLAEFFGRKYAANKNKRAISITNRNSS